MITRVNYREQKFLIKYSNKIFVLSYLRHLLGQNVGQNVDGVGFSFGGGSSSQQELQESDLMESKHKQTET